MGAGCGLADLGRPGGQGAGRAALLVRPTELDCPSLTIQGPLTWKFWEDIRVELGTIKIKARTTTIKKKTIYTRLWACRCIKTDLQKGRGWFRGNCHIRPHRALAGKQISQTLRVAMLSLSVSELALGLALSASAASCETCIYTPILCSGSNDCQRCYTVPNS